MAERQRFITRGTVVRLDPANGLPWVSVPELGVGRQIGPCPTIRGDVLAEGDMVLCVSVSGVHDDLAVIGKFGPALDLDPVIAPTAVVPVQPEPPVPSLVGQLYWDTDEVGYDYNWGAVRDWDSATAYTATAPVSVVTYQGETYVALAASTNVAPSSDATKWRKVAAKSDATARVGTVFPSNPADGLLFFETSGGSFIGQDTYGRQAQRVLKGGGRRFVGSAGSLSWGQPFYTRGAGQKSTIAPSGYHEIAMPPVGTIIERLGTSGSTTVISSSVYNNPAGRYLTLSAGESLWYALPLGSAFNTVGTFWITSGSPTVDYEVPEWWVLICTRTQDYPTTDRSSHVWGDGQEQSLWTTPSTLNGWVNYDNTQHNGAGWKKENGRVYWKGLIKSGAAGTTICTLDPTTNGNMEGLQSDGKGLYACGSDTGIARVDATPSALIHMSGGTSWLSLSQISYMNG